VSVPAEAAGIVFSRRPGNLRVFADDPRSLDSRLAGIPVQKSKRFESTRFTPEVFVEATEELWKGLRDDDLKIRPSGLLNVELDDAEWNHDSVEEFIADYRRTRGNARYSRSRRERHIVVSLYRGGESTVVDVMAESREVIERVFTIFERSRDNCRVTAPPARRERPTIFIGHGRSTQWRDLKDHLQDKWNFRVTAYESGARAGHTIRDVLEDLLRRSSFAILVMTGEDVQGDGGLRARQNVVHESGLFQGKLGFSRAIVILEDGTEEFSNIHGLGQIRFSKGRIQEVFGDVVATIRREFPNAV